MSIKHELNPRRSRIYLGIFAVLAVIGIITLAVRGHARDANGDSPGSPSVRSSSVASADLASAKTCFIWARPVADGEQVSADMLLLSDARPLPEMEESYPSGIDKQNGSTDPGSYTNSSIYRERLRLLGRYTAHAYAAGSPVAESELLLSIPVPSQPERQAIWLASPENFRAQLEHLQRGNLISAVIIENSRLLSATPDEKVFACSVLALDRANARLCLDVPSEACHPLLRAQSRSALLLVPAEARSKGPVPAAPAEPAPAKPTETKPAGPAPTAPANSAPAKASETAAPPSAPSAASPASPSSSASPKSAPSAAAAPALFMRNGQSRLR